MLKLESGPRPEGQELGEGPYTLSPLRRRRVRRWPPAKPRRRAKPHRPMAGRARPTGCGTTRKRTSTRGVGTLPGVGAGRAIDGDASNRFNNLRPSAPIDRVRSVPVGDGVPRPLWPGPDRRERRGSTHGRRTLGDTPLAIPALEAIDIAEGRREIEVGSPTAPPVMGRAVGLGVGLLALHLAEMVADQVDGAGEPSEPPSIQAT